MNENINDVNSSVILEKPEKLGKWADYFDSFFNRMLLSNLSMNCWVLQIIMTK